MKTPNRILFALTAALLLSPIAASAAENKPAAIPAPAIELGAPFADNAILQREMDLPVWGWSQPGTTVTVEFAGQKETAKAGADGKWLLKLKPLKASAEPAEMVIQESGDGSQESGKRVVLRNLLVGEVWMASGQSNMQWLAGKCDVAKIVAELAAKGEQPPIREFGISNCYSALHPVEHASGEWQTGTYGKLGFEALDIWCPFDNCNHLADVVARLGPDGLKQLLAKHQLTVGIPARAPLSVWMESP